MIGPAHLRAGLRVLRRHLRYAGGNPRKLYWVARRAVSLAREGALPGVLERHLVEARHYANYDAWCLCYEPPADFDFAPHVAALARRPLISILLPVWNPPPALLEQTLASVKAQAYPDWQLCIVDDASTDPDVRSLLEREARAEPRIRLQRREVNGGIAAATNTALALASGEYCAFLDHDDTLARHALFALVQATVERPDAELLFSDEDKLDAGGRRTQPFFKPDWDDEWLRTTNCVLHFTMIRTQTLRELGGVAQGIDGAQDWDLVLRVAERVGRARIVHVPQVLYHWRELPGSTAAATFEKPALVAAQRKVMHDTLARRNERGEVLQQTSGWRIVYAVPSPAPRISIVIPTRDRPRLLRACIDSIRKHAKYPDCEIVLVDNDSRDPQARAYLEQLAASGTARVVPYPHRFNYAAQCNLGVRASSGSMVLLLNNDIEASADGWLQELASLAARPGIGLVGATLYYPDSTLQHGGVILGLNGIGDRPWIGTPRGFAGPQGRARAVREVSAMVTACAMVVRDRYLEVDGMNEELAVSCNDVDLCLRLSRAGYRHLVTPYAELVHHESASRGYADDPENLRLNRAEEARFAALWRDRLEHDPLYNPNLTLQGQAYALAWPPRRSAEPWRGTDAKA
jgi:O-antigen biosynthesis protein